MYDALPVGQLKQQHVNTERTKYSEPLYYNSGNQHFVPYSEVSLTQMLKFMWFLCALSLTEKSI